jgi:hypothetical protein
MKSEERIAARQSDTKQSAERHKTIGRATQNNRQSDTKQSAERHKTIGRATQNNWQSNTKTIGRATQPGMHCLVVWGCTSMAAGRLSNYPVCSPKVAAGG